MVLKLGCDPSKHEKFYWGHQIKKKYIFDNKKHMDFQYIKGSLNKHLRSVGEFQQNFSQYEGSGNERSPSTLLIVLNAQNTKTYLKKGILLKSFGY